MRSAVARGYTLSVMGRRRLYSFNVRVWRPLCEGRGGGGAPLGLSPCGIVPVLFWSLLPRNDSLYTSDTTVPSLLCLLLCCCSPLQSAALRGLRGAQALEEVPDMKGLQKHAGRADVHTLLQASNAPIQGTSADILKAALLQLHDRLVPAPYCCRLLLTVRANGWMTCRPKWQKE